MNEKINEKYRIPWNFAAGLILGIWALVLQLMARNISGFGQWYAVNIYPGLVRVWGGISGIFSFSVVEFGIYIGAAGCLAYAVINIRQIKKLGSGIMFLLGLLLFVYTINCGINYYRKPFSAYLNLQTDNVTRDELYQLCETLTKQVKESYGKLDEEMSLDAMNQEGDAVMYRLGVEFPSLSGYYPRPKPVTVSWILSVQQLCGMYSPFTIEANYNKEMTAYNIPHTICHELSHLRGFMREDEANFIGYLACIQSEQAEFRYSGYLTGWIYATNQLVKSDADQYMKLYRQLPEGVIRDLENNSAFWNRYEGKVAEVSNQMNDSYLKMNSQTDGVESYGRMVDLMLAYEKKKGI